MEWPVARDAVLRLLAAATPGDRVNLSFLGGEPLVNRALIQRATRFAAAEARARDIRIGFSITTNGTLVASEDCDFFEEHGFCVTVSLDGVGASHDRLRPFRGGGGSYQRVLARLMPLLECQQRMQVSARVTVTPLNLDLCETLDEFVRLGFHSIGFSPMLSSPTRRLELDQCDIATMLQQMILCGRKFEAETAAGRRYPFSNLVEALRQIHRGTHRPYPCGAGAGYFGVSAGGGLFACHRFVENDAGSLGDVAHGIDHDKRNVWLAQRHVHRQEPCNSCWARYLCGGGCHHEVIYRGRPACDFIRGWLHYCLEAYVNTMVSCPAFFAASGSSDLEQLTSDICVIGGGPAGSSTAIRLAQLGYSVTLIERRGAARRPVGEGLAAPILHVLDALLLRKKVQSADFLWCDRTVSRWAEGASGRNGPPALIVDRSRFDQILLKSAADAGAVTLTGASARRPIDTGDAWVVPVDAVTGPVRVKARLLVDASGRRPGRLVSGAPTVALCGSWRGVPWSDIPELRVEVGEHCWFWGAPMPDGSVTAVVFLDPRWSRGLDRKARIVFYRSLLSNSTLFADCLRGALVGEICVRNATCWMSDHPASERYIRVGDALLAADPISSQGVQAAMRSGIQAGVVIHTLLSGGDSSAAIEFYQAMQRQDAAHNSRLAGAIYASESLYFSSFWLARCGSPRCRSRCRARRCCPVPMQSFVFSRPHLVTVPVIDGDMVCWHRAVSHPALHKPVVWLGGLALTPLLLLIGDGCSVESILLLGATPSRQLSPRMWLLG